MLRLRHKFRRLFILLVALVGVSSWLILNPDSYEQIVSQIEENINIDVDFGEAINAVYDVVATRNEINVPETGSDQALLAATILEKLEVKGRSPKTGYSREEFYTNWPTVDGCNLRQKIIRREFGDSAKLDGCNVISGEYDEPYTGEHKIFSERSQISTGVQIDHVVALSDAWQKGADNDHMNEETRYQLATDPLNLLAVDSSSNQSKSDGDAATWLPKNKAFRCQYIARQISVKFKYHLWVTQAEKEAMQNVLEKCPNEPAVGVTL